MGGFLQNGSYDWGKNQNMYAIETIATDGTNSQISANDWIFLTYEVGLFNRQKSEKKSLTECND